MVYTVFMILVLLTFGAMWRGHVLHLPLFLLTVAVVLLHVVSDMRLFCRCWRNSGHAPYSLLTADRVVSALIFPHS